MKFWFDTEFYEDGRIIDLISIGIVAEDGREYYAETAGAHVFSRRTRWLETNVMPHLTGEEKFRPTIRREVQEFVGENPEFWAYYADYDWVALCQLHGRMIDLPTTWPMWCRDLKQYAGSIELPRQEGTEHHALADARWTRMAWEHVRKVRGE